MPTAKANVIECVEPTRREHIRKRIILSLTTGSLDVAANAVTTETVKLDPNGAYVKALKKKQPTISHHLGLLRMGRLVNSQRQGKSVTYTADKANLKALAAGLAQLTP
jgi:DNA-binding transcriptional ArsR family regulator